MEVKTVYTSSDGFEFSSEEKCREHEENKINSIHSAAYAAIRFFIFVSTTFI